MAVPGDILGRVPLFRHLSDKEMKLLGEASRLVRVPKGTLVFHEGDPGDYLLVVSSGHVKLVLFGRDGRELVLEKHGPGSVFGELAVIDGAPRSASAVTLEATVFLQLKRAPLLDLIDRFPAFGAHLLVHLARLLRDNTYRLRTLSMFDVYGRILRTLIGLARRHGATNGTRLVLQQRPSTVELAHMINCSRETVSRAMKVLQDNGFVSLSGNSLTIASRTIRQYCSPV